MTEHEIIELARECGIHVFPEFRLVFVKFAQACLNRGAEQRDAELMAVGMGPVGEITAEDMGKPFNAISIRTHFYKEVPAVGTKLYTHAQPAPVNQQLLEALKEIDNWLVCAAIATPEDMAQSFSAMEQLARAAIAAAEAHTGVNE